MRHLDGLHPRGDVNIKNDARPVPRVGVGLVPVIQVRDRDPPHHIVVVRRVRRHICRALGISITTTAATNIQPRDPRLPRTSDEIRNKRLRVEVREHLRRVPRARDGQPEVVPGVHDLLVVDARDAARHAVQVEVGLPQRAAEPVLVRVRVPRLQRVADLVEDEGEARAAPRQPRDAARREVVDVAVRRRHVHQPPRQVRGAARAALVVVVRDFLDDAG